MRIVHITNGPAENCVRARKCGQWSREAGLETIYVDLYAQVEANTPLLTLEDLDGCKHIAVNLRSQNVVAEMLAEHVRPDIVHCHHYEALEAMCLSAISNPLWHYSPGDWPALRKPEVLKSTRLVATISELEGRRILPSLPQHMVWLRSVRAPHFECLCDYTIAVSEALRTLKRCDEYLPNAPCAPKHPLQTDLLRSWANTDKKLVIQIGNFGPHRMGHQLMRAIKELGPDKYQLVLMGKFLGQDVDSMRQLFEEVGGLQLEAQPYNYPDTPVDETTMLDWISGADVSFVGLSGEWDNHLHASPNKLWESAIAGTPVLSSYMLAGQPHVRTYNNTVDGLKHQLEAVCAEPRVPISEWELSHAWDYQCHKLRAAYDCK